MIKLIFVVCFSINKKSTPIRHNVQHHKNMFWQYIRQMSNSWHAWSLHFLFINGESVQRFKPTYHSHWTHQEAMLQIVSDKYFGPCYFVTRCFTKLNSWVTEKIAGSLFGGNVIHEKGILKVEPVTGIFYLTWWNYTFKSFS